MVVQDGTGPTGLVARIKNIILTPDAEWQVIAEEPSTVGAIYRSYVMPLAAIGPVCQFIGSVVFGYSMFGITVRTGLISGLVGAIVSYVLGLVGIYVLAVIVDFLAPNFQGQRNQTQSFKLAAYGATASWLAGVFALIPALRLLGILGLYSLYLFYKGLPVLTRSPKEKALPYTVVVIIVAIVLSILVGLITAPLLGVARVGGLGGGTITSTDDTTTTGSITLPGGGKLDLGKLQQAAKSLEQATKPAGQADASSTGTADATASAAQPVDVEVLKAMLPTSLPDGTARSQLETGSGQFAGIGGANAEAHYDTADKSVTLSVTDMGAAGAFAALGGAFGVQGTKETATSYSKVSQVDGRMVTEEYDRENRHGEFGVVVASRFMVHAEGNNIAMADLKSAVSTIDLARLEKLGK